MADNTPFSSWDPLGVIVTFTCPLASVLVQGFMDGTFVDAKRDEAAFTKKVGATGAVARVRNRNRSGTIKLTLMLTSETNAIFSAIHAAGEEDPLTDDDVGEFQVKSGSESTRCHAGNAWIQKVADVSYGKDLAGREWTFDVDVLTMDLGDIIL